VPEERETLKNTYTWKLMLSRPVGRPKIRWMDNVLKDIQAMKIVNWKGSAQDINKRNSIVEQAKAHVEL
jgi:hypothetical protein